MRVAVVGAGIMGCSAARALARDGHDVTLYEQFEVGHDRGSSHGRSRIVRLAYPDPEWVRLAEESFHGWRELEDESGVRLLELSGLVELFESGGSQDALAAAGARFELLSPGEARRRWPIRVPDGRSVLFQPRAGMVRADDALRAFLDSARRHGATLVERTRVGSVDDVDAECVVVTAGSWVRGLVPEVEVRTTCETVAYFRRTGPPAPSVVELGATGGAAMYSLWDPVHGLKAGAHHAGRPCDPDVPDGPADPAVVERIADWVASVHVDVDPRPVVAQTCRYTTTADESFVLHRRDRVVVGSACSGHGFKFAPAVGRRLADLVGPRLP